MNDKRKLYTFLATVRVLCERVRANRIAYKAFRVVRACLLAALVILAYTIVIFRVASTKAVERYEREIAKAQAEEIAPYMEQLNAEAEALAKVLYGVKDNSTDDLQTYCWCVFNRVDNPAFPSTITEVIEQPNQWMGYDADNPILESLYQLAREQLNAWHTEPHRPVSNEYVFMSWSESDICLRDNFQEGSNAHYWRLNQ